MLQIPLFVSVDPSLSRVTKKQDAAHSGSFASEEKIIRMVPEEGIDYDGGRLSIRDGSIFPLRKPSLNVRDDRVDLSGYVPTLRRYFAKRVEPGDVEDLVQDVLLRMHVRGQGEGIANIEGYLFQVAASVLTDRARRDQVRHRGAHHELTEAHHPADDLTPDRVLHGREDVERLIAALEEMPELTRDSFVLHRFEEMSYGAISDHLGISVSAVGRHIMKAMRFLAERDLP